MVGWLSARSLGFIRRDDVMDGKCMKEVWDYVVHFGIEACWVGGVFCMEQLWSYRNEAVAI